MDVIKRYLVTIQYLDREGNPHTLQAKFTSLMLAITKTKATCLKDYIAEVTNINIVEDD